jgi:hypothetical protein
MRQSQFFKKPLTERQQRHCRRSVACRSALSLSQNGHAYWSAVANLPRMT